LGAAPSRVDGPPVVCLGVVEGNADLFLVDLLDDVNLLIDFRLLK